MSQHYRVIVIGCGAYSYVSRSPVRVIEMYQSSGFVPVAMGPSVKLPPPDEVTGPTYFF